MNAPVGVPARALVSGHTFAFGPAFAFAFGPAFAVALALGACGGPADFTEVLDRAVERGLPGVALYVRADDGAVWIGQSGVSSIEDATPLRADDRFRIFGATQPFVAVTVLQLADEGRLGLDNTVPQLAGLDLVYEVPNVERITLRHALRHASGLFDYAETFGFQEALLGPDADLARKWEPAELLSHISGRGYRPPFAPGEGAEFSASNPTLLGIAIEGVAGRTLAEELRDRIFVPLGMTAAYLSGAEGVEDTAIPGYVALEENVLAYGIGASLPQARPGLVNFSSVDASWTWAAGGIVTTLGELSAFAEALLAGELLSPDRQQAMFDFRPPSWVRADGEELEFGLGLVRRQTAGGPAIGHEGAGGGFETMLYRLPDLGLTFVAMTNSSGQDITLEAVFQDVIELVRAGDPAALFGG